MALLIYSPNCQHSVDCLKFMDKNPQLKQIVRLHNVNTHGLPPQLRQKITRVPTILTKDGKKMVGAEVKQWMASLIPPPVITNCDLMGGCGMSSLDGGDMDNGMFGLDSYGQSLQPAMTPELQAKINKDVTTAFGEMG